MAARLSRTAKIAKARSAAPASVPGEEGGFLGLLMVLGGVVLMVGGACAFVFPVEVPAPREGVLAGGAVAGAAGLALLGAYFHKFGKL